MNDTLYVSSKRQHMDWTGIYVRAKSPMGTWISADISNLDRSSLINWLDQGQEKSPDWTLNVVLLLLDHEPLLNHEPVQITPIKIKKEKPV